MESSDCAAALDPSIFHGRGGAELDRFLDGADSRGELALIVSAIGNAEDDTPRHPLATADASILLPGAEGSIAGRRLPIGAKPSLVSGLRAEDRDLGLRLLGRPADAPWWDLSVSGTVMEPGGGGPAVRYEPAGHLEPILEDGLGHPVVAAWVPDSGGQRWYVIPGATAWHGILDWLVQHALPTLVPEALRRARSPHALDPALQTPAEAAARRAIEDLDADYVHERQKLELELDQAKTVAEPMRNGLLYGTGSELENAVAAVLEAAGFEAIAVDELLGDTSSADLIVIFEEERRLVEIKSASGRASESLVAQLTKHLATWPQLRPGEPVGGGVLVVNHEHRLEPDQRAREVYSRPEFVASLTVPVVSTHQLFDWWRDADWPAIRSAVLAQNAAPGAGNATSPPPPTSAPTRQSLSSPPAPGRWRRRFARRGRDD